jgi:hypothetical protein
LFDGSLLDSVSFKEKMKEKVNRLSVLWYKESDTIN